MMKKIFLILIPILFIISCDKKPDKDNTALREETLKACQNAAISAETPEAEKKLFITYCNCSTDKIMGKFTYGEMMQMRRPTPELQKRLTKLTQPCLDDLKTKLAELKK